MEALDTEEKRRVVGTDEAKNRPEAGAEEGAPGSRDGREAPQGPHEEGGGGHPVRVGEDLEERKRAEGEIQAAPRRQVGQLEEETPEAPTEKHEGESAREVSVRYSQACQPARRSRQQRERRHRAEQPEGEERAAPECARHTARQPPFQVDDLGAGARRLDELVAKKERPILRLLHERDIGVDVVDPVEGPGEGASRGGRSAARM